MAAKLMQASRRQELKFLSHQKKGGHGAGEGEDEEETHREQEDGSLARSSLGLSQEFRVAHGCFSSALKRNFKAFCGRLGRWSPMHHKKPSSLYRYLHINAPLDPPFAFQKQKSKSKQALLDHPVGLHEPSLDPLSSPPAFQKQKSKSKPAFLDHSIEHEEIKDIHLDPQGTTFSSVDGIKCTSILDLYEEIKPQEQRPPISGDHREQRKKIASINSHEEKHDTHLPSKAKPSLIEGFEQQSQLILAHRAGSKRQSEVLSGIHELMLGVTHSLGLVEATPLISFDKSVSSRSLQVKIPKLNVHSAMSRPHLSLQGPDNSPGVNGQEKIIRSIFDSYHTHPEVHDGDGILCSLATHVFSLRNQVIKGGFGGVQYPSLQGKEAKMHRGTSFNDHYEGGDAMYDIKKSMTGLISGRKLEDLADLEEFLQCYMRLYSPCFLDMVNQFFREICNDIFECEGWFDDKDPFIHTQNAYPPCI